MKKLSLFLNVQAIIQFCLWSIVGFAVSFFIAFPNLNVSGSVSPLASLILVAACLFFGGVLAAVNSIIGVRREYSHGKIDFTEAELKRAATLPLPQKPYWLSGLIKATIQMFAFVAVAAIISFVIFPGGLPRSVLAAMTALMMGVHGVITVYRNAGEETLKALGHKDVAPQPFSLYIWREHVLGGALINYGINGLITYLMYHFSENFPHQAVEFETLFVDTLITCIPVCVLTAVSSELLGANDGRLHETVGPAKMPKFIPHIALRIPIYAVIGICVGLIHGGLLHVLGVESMTIFWFMNLKGFITAIVAGLGASLAGYWAVSSKMSDKAH